MPANTETKAVVIMETSAGTIKIEMWPDKSPGTVSNFLQYADDKFFDGLIFHRVIAGFMIQGGGFTADMVQKSTRDPIKNEASSEAKNKRGTIAMARTSNLHSATGQFFINLVDNDFLDHKGETQDAFGYCVFGKVIEGMEVVDKIGACKTGVKRTRMGPMPDVPVDTVTIKSVRRQ